MRTLGTIAGIPQTRNRVYYWGYLKDSVWLILDEHDVVQILIDYLFAHLADNESQA